jgi:hypothetical protein
VGYGPRVPAANPRRWGLGRGRSGLDPGLNDGVP